MNLLEIFIARRSRPEEHIMLNSMCNNCWSDHVNITRCIYLTIGKINQGTFCMCFVVSQVPSALAFQSATHNIISFINLTNMSVSNNNKSLDKCILRVL